MSNNLISSDDGVDAIFVHSGVSSTITESFSTPDLYSKGLAYDGTNIISGDNSADQIYLHSGISSGITDSFASPGGQPRGLTFDGTNLISTDSGTSRIYVHSGISSTITNSFSSTAPGGLAFDGTNLISADTSGNKIHLHSGVSSTITDSFASPDSYPYALTFDGTNLISADIGTDVIYVHSGISSTITSTFDTPGGFPYGLTFELLVNQAPTAPTSLEVDEKSDPTGANCISDLTPGFTAIYNDPDAGDQSNAIEIQVGTAEGLSDMWNSGWIADSTLESNRCTTKTYDGAALSVGTSYWWRCRFRDDDDGEGAWSEWQQFDMCAAPALNLVQMALI